MDERTGGDEDRSAGDESDRDDDGPPGGRQTDDEGSVVEQVRSVADACFGEDYLGVGETREAARADGSTHLLVLVETDAADSLELLSSTRGETTDRSPDQSETVVGFGIVGLYTPRRLAEHLHVPPAEWPSTLHNAEQVAFPRTIAVRPDRRDERYTRSLTEAGYELLESADPDAWVAVAWERADGSVAMDEALQSAELEPRRRIEGYWRRESLAEDYDCADCGQPPCTCAARFYYRE